MEDRVAARSFASVRLVVLAPIQSRCDVVGLPPVRSHELLEAFVTASPFDHDAAICRRPDDCPGDQRLTGERPEPIPDRRLERVAELVASAPPLDVDQLVAIESTQHDPVGAPATAGPTAETDGGDGRAAAPRAPAKSTRRSGARAGRAAAAPGGCARPRARTGCGTGRLGGPYNSGTNGHAIRARRAAPSAVVSSSGSGRGTVRPAWPSRSGTTRRARARGRSSAARNWLVRRRVEVGPVRAHRADPEVRRRRPRRGPVSALEIRKPDGGVQRVHSASTRSRTSANRAPRPYTPHCRRFAGISCPSESVRERP